MPAPLSKRVIGPWPPSHRSPQHSRDRDEQGTQPIRPDEQGDSLNRVQGTRAPTSPRGRGYGPIDRPWAPRPSADAVSASSMARSGVSARPAASAAAPGRRAARSDEPRRALLAYVDVRGTSSMSPKLRPVALPVGLGSATQAQRRLWPARWPPPRSISSSRSSRANARSTTRAWCSARPSSGADPWPLRVRNHGSPERR